MRMVFRQVRREARPRAVGTIFRFRLEKDESAQPDVKAEWQFDPGGDGTAMCQLSNSSHHLEVSSSQLGFVPISRQCFYHFV